MTVALWLAIPARRQVIVWILAMFIGATFVLSGVFASFATIKGLSEAVDFTSELTGGRYLLPVLVGWFTTMMTIFFTYLTSFTSTPGASADVHYPPTSVGSSGGLEDDP